MSHWRAENDVAPPQDFMEALMGDDDEDFYGARGEPESDFEEEDEFDEMGCSSSAPPPPTSHRSSPQVPLARTVADGDADRRSRSPLNLKRAVTPTSSAGVGGRRSRSPTKMEHELISPTPPVMNVVVYYDYNDDGELYQVGDPVPPEGIIVPLDGLEVQLEEPRPDGLQEDEFWEPDAHALYTRDERMDAGGRDVMHESDRMDESVRDESDGMDRSIRDETERLDGSVRNEGDRRGVVRCRTRGGVRGRTSRRGRALRVRQGRTRRTAEPRGKWQPGHPLHEIWLHDEDVPIEFREMVMDLVRRRETRAQEMRERSLRRLRSERIRETVGEDSEIEDEEEFQDAIAERDLLEGESQPFDWQPMATFQGTEETFTPERTGSVGSYSTAYEAFRSYWDDRFLRFIADETNRYASTISSDSFQRDWYPTNSHEILCLYAFWMMLCIIRMPTIESCFSVDPLLKTEIFRRMFSRQRYINLSRALHFVDCESDNANPTGNATSSDRLYRLRPILDHLNAKFQANYIPSQNIALDESLMLWKGRLDIKQYIRTKAARFGIKSFELCESTTGYLWSFIIYTGKQANLDLSQNPLMKKSTAVVMKLISPLLNKGYRLFMDNWYNSPLLARYLKRNGTDCVGTLRPNLSDVPELVSKAPLKQGQLIARHSGDVCVLAWQDKNRVTMLSTCHGSEIALATVPSKDPPAHRPLLFKPQVVLDYNKFMGGVDLKDQMLEPYLLERKKCAKWYMKLFKRLLNCSILNSRILLQSSTGHHQHHLSFRLHLVDTILDNHLAHIPRSRPNRQVFIRPNAHWPIRHAQRASDIAMSRSTRFQCVLCTREGRKNSKTMFRCETCDVPLCVDPCFKAYHS